MMKSIIASFLLIVVAVTSFTPQPIMNTKVSSTALNFGSFGGKPKKKEPKKIGGMDASVFGGKGKKVTVREDEDAAMWVEEEDPNKPKKKNIFGF